MHKYVVNIISEIFVLIELVFLLHRDLIKMKFSRNIYAAMMLTYLQLIFCLCINLLLIAFFYVIM